MASSAPPNGEEPRLVWVFLRLNAGRDAEIGLKRGEKKEKRPSSNWLVNTGDCSVDADDISIPGVKPVPSIFYSRALLLLFSNVFLCALFHVDA